MVSLLFLFVTLAFSGIYFDRIKIAYIAIALAFVLASFLLFHHIGFGSLNIDL